MAKMEVDDGKGCEGGRDGDDEVEDEENMEKKRKKKKHKKKKKEQMEVVIQTVSEHPNKISPLVGYFPSGFDPLKPPTREVKKSPQQPPKPSVRVFKHEKRTNRLQLVVSPSGSNLDFVGTNYSGEAAAAQVCTYALGVLDKQAQTLKIVPIASNKIFRLEPRVRGSNISENEPSNGIKEELTAEQKADKVRDLTLKYSSKTSIKKAKKLESLHQQDDPRSKQDLERKVAELNVNKEALESVGNFNARNIPPHDISATTPQTAYPLDKIIFQGEWDYLLDVFELSEEDKVLAPDVYPSFVCNRVHKLGDIEDEARKKKLACILSYITHLIKFKDKHSLDGASSAKHHRIPNILFQKFSSLFTDSNSNRLVDEKRGLLISYILVLTLYVDNFRSNPSDIAKDLRMTTMAVRPHYEYLGCKLVREGTFSLATLPVPLEFPKPSLKRRK